MIANGFTDEQIKAIFEDAENKRKHQEDLTYIRARLLINRRTSNPRKANEFFHRWRRYGNKPMCAEDVADLFKDFNTHFLAGMLEAAAELSLVHRWYIYNGISYRTLHEAITARGSSAGKFEMLYWPTESELL